MQAGDSLTEGCQYVVVALCDQPVILNRMAEKKVISFNKHYDILQTSQLCVANLLSQWYDFVHHFLVLLDRFTILYTLTGQTLMVMR